ncbi:30S ribosomal protein S7 [Rickettsiella grylli]|uniref:Small ribosomal subunit protein uS7 n=1 Tax=Rickettsiella grylli TaxID=59196 RepID=A8PNQ8_9COXI|nr:30S ribosomal protein S7 [Rickettsiella grylli]EDP46304.1 ribosomal protein S7 [Rickettsiella grylli]OJA00331.1 30S ribosomal protein S7 [Rickettsiella grylli]
MPRRRVAAKRVILPDPKFKSELLSKFINSVMKNGKKAVAEKIVYGALEWLNLRLKEKSKKAEGASGENNQNKQQDLDAATLLDVFDQALDNIRPNVEVRARRVGGSTYQIPVEVRPSRRTALAMRWLKLAANQRSEKTMAQRLSAEILDAYDNKGIAVKKREDTHRMAKANQAFAHFRFG